MLLSACGTQVLQEFGGTMPASLISPEDAEREFLMVRALELQLLGIAATEKTITSTALTATTRTAVMPTGLTSVILDFVEFAPTYDSTGNTRLPVEVVPLEDLPNYEGAYAISFYGNPGYYKLSWDAWLDGTVYVIASIIEDLTATTSATNLTFPAAFWPLLFKKTAYNLVRVALLKLATTTDADDANAGRLATALGILRDDLKLQVCGRDGRSGWDGAFRQFRNLDPNTKPHLRRSIEETWMREGNPNYNVLLG